MPPLSIDFRPEYDRFNQEESNKSDLWRVLQLLHIMGIHLRYHSWIKLEKSTKKDEDSQREKVSRRRKSKCPSWNFTDFRRKTWTKLVIWQVPNDPKAFQDFNEGFQEMKVGFKRFLWSSQLCICKNLEKAMNDVGILVQQKILANCFLNCLQIWRGRDWITVFCRVRHKKWRAKGETLQRAVFWSKLFCMRTNSTTILRIFQSGSCHPLVVGLSF